MNNQFLNQPMNALSWKQPFGTAMLFGKIETRVWSTNYRGWVLICTSKVPYMFSSVINITGEHLLRKMIHATKEDTDTNKLGGYAIGIGRLVDCRKMKPEDEEKAFVKFSEHLYVHIYEDVQAIKPFPWKGIQGWKKVDQNIIDQIEIIQLNG